MMLRKSLFPLVMALLLGLAAAVSAQRWMQSRLSSAEAEKRNGVPVVVAAVEIPYGEKIKPDYLKTVQWPREHVPLGVFQNAAQVVGKVANQKILAGETILQSRAVADASGSLLASLIEPSKRAVTVRVNDVIGVAGFLLPGNRVDVLATRMTTERRANTRTLLENLKVLAVDQTTQVEKDKPVVVRAVTLEVEPSAAVRLVQATEEGTVQLALRNPDDRLLSSGEIEPPTETVAVLAPPVVAPPPRVVRRLAPAPPPAVTVIRQTQMGETRTQN